MNGKNAGIAYRWEEDSIGRDKVPADAYYGIQSQRAAENFLITGRTIHPLLVESTVQIKKAAAITNQEVGMLDSLVAQAMVTACDEILSGKLLDAFIVDPIQGGAGTSVNMNANEVIANRASEILGGEKGSYTLVHPNDHVNCGQSTNDVFPSAGRITAIKLLEQSVMAMHRLEQALHNKAMEFDSVIKMGRTQLQDAVPIRLGQEFAAYRNVVSRDRERLKEAQNSIRVLNMGGTAIGTGINADVEYIKRIVPNLAQVTGLEFEQAEDLIDATQNLDALALVSSILKVCAINLSKICNDLRLMSSGPVCGLGEINLPQKQNGSSIMPGKVNPVIPEVVSQAAFRIAGNDLTITMAIENGQLELNAFEPVIFYSLFESIEILTAAVKTLTENCICGITVNAERCREQVEHSVGMITAVCPYIGYNVAADIAKQALRNGRPVRALLLEKGLLSEEELEQILDPMAMTYPSIWRKESTTV